MFLFPEKALILFFKATQFGLFGVSTPVKGYVNKKTGKVVTPYTGIRHRALQKPNHPMSDHLFAQADATVTSSHVQPEPAKAPVNSVERQEAIHKEVHKIFHAQPAKPRPPKPLSPEKQEAVRAKVQQILAHAQVDAQHAPQHGNAHRKLYLAQLADLTGLPGDERMAAQQEVNALFAPKVKEATQDPNAFITSPSGSIDFGRIAGDAATAIKHPEGPIRLQAGFHDDATGRGFGKVHIDRDLRAAELAQNGYPSTEALIEDVAQQFTAIYEGKNSSFILVKENGKTKIAFVSVKQGNDGVFYSVGSGLVTRTDYLKKKSRLWERAQSNQPKPPSAISGQQPGSKTILPPPAPDRKAAPVPQNYHTPQARALAEALKRGDLGAALTVLQPLSLPEARDTLLHAGFSMVTVKTKKDLLAWAQKELLAAAKAHQDGFDLYTATHKAFPPHARILFFRPLTLTASPVVSLHSPLRKLA